MHVSSDQKFWDNIGEKFYGKYCGIDRCHQGWKDLVVSGRPITIPSGREWIIELGRDRYGELKIPWTVLTNYPNQGLGADVMMLVRLMLWRRLKGSGVKFISTVHDDIKFDTPEKHVDLIKNTCAEVFNDLPAQMKKVWNYEWVVPMTCEVFQGNNMLDMEKIYP